MSDEWIDDAYVDRVMAEAAKQDKEYGRHFENGVVAGGIAGFIVGIGIGILLASIVMTMGAW